MWLPNCNTLQLVAVRARAGGGDAVYEDIMFGQYDRGGNSHGGADERLALSRNWAAGGV